VEQFSSEPNGVISLHGLVEFIAIPPGLDFIALNGFLVIMVSAGVDDGPDHIVQVTLRDDAGRELGPPTEAPVRGGSAVAGFPFYCPFAFHLQDLVLPGPGTYSFQVSVDGHHVNSVRLPVVRRDLTGTSSSS
jgi:hypothetical protein